jgi:hypothetical protein
LAEYGANHNHGGSEARHFDAYTYRAGPISGISAGGWVRQAKGNRVISVASRRAFANSSSVPIAGFEPNRNEMVFERASRSCYPCEPFTALINQSPGGIVLAGFAGDSACPSTLIDAFHRNHRNHKVTYLSDASASHAFDELPADDVHRTVSKISGIYGDVYETTARIASTLPCKLGNGKSAGG